MTDREQLPAGEDEPASKSALKRELAALQKLAQQLAELPNSRYNQLDLSEEVRDAIALYRRLKHGDAKRRQLRFIAKLINAEGSDAITESLAAFESQDKHFRDHFHRIESLRDRLVAEGDPALGPLLTEYPDLDRQHLRQLIRQAGKEKKENKPPAAARKLFDYLRGSIPWG